MCSVSKKPSSHQAVNPVPSSVQDEQLMHDQGVFLLHAAFEGLQNGTIQVAKACSTHAQSATLLAVYLRLAGTHVACTVDMHVRPRTICCVSVKIG